MPATTWVLCDEDGNAVTEISNAAERVFRATRNRGRSATITLGHGDTEATRLFEIMRNGVPQLRYYRGDADGVKQLRLSAYLTAVEEDLSDDDDGGDSLVLTFKDPFGRLFGDGSGGEPGRVLLAAKSYVGTDQAQIAWDLIADLNATSDTGLRQGSLPATIGRDREYVVGKNVGEAIVQLTEVQGGFDFEITPLDPTAESGKLGEFVAYGAQGSDRADLLWGYGKGTMANVQAVRRGMTPPVNRVHMSTSEGLLSIQVDETSRATFGEWAVSLSAPSGVVEQATLDQQALGFLRPAWINTVSFQPDHDLPPFTFDDFWLGDTGRFRAIDGAFAEVFVPRVTGVTITEDADGQESHELVTEVVA